MCDQVENNQVFLSVEMNSNFQSLRGCTTNSFSTPRLKGTAWSLADVVATVHRCAMAQVASMCRKETSSQGNGKLTNWWHTKLTAMVAMSIQFERNSSSVIVSMTAHDNKPPDIGAILFRMPPLRFMLAVTWIAARRWLFRAHFLSLLPCRFGTRVASFPSNELSIFFNPLHTCVTDSFVATKDAQVSGIFPLRE